jgi:hypothetical protein
VSKDPEHLTRVSREKKGGGADVRGVYRGNDVSIAHSDDRLPGMHCPN